MIAVAVLDGSNKPLPEPLEVEKGVSPLPDTTQAHRVIIASEEQFKIFTLPNLKPYCKYKLTAHEGARIRRMNFATFNGNHPDNKDYSEIDLLCLTNIGECLILTIPDLKRQLTAATIRREDIKLVPFFTVILEILYDWTFNINSLSIRHILMEVYIISCIFKTMFGLLLGTFVVQYDSSNSAYFTFIGNFGLAYSVSKQF